MGFLNFLTNAVIENVEPKSIRTGNTKKQRNPAEGFLGFRIWADGSVYPSQALVTMFGLEYPAATVNVVKDKEGKDKNVFTVVGFQGNGLDIINTAQWTQMKGNAFPFIAAAIAPKDSPKLDLFGLTRYDKDGSSLSSVLDQGSATFGKESLLPMLKDLYKAVPNAEGFIDVQLVTEDAGGRNLRSTNGLEFLPKVVSRGADKGKPDYIRRENVDIFMLYPVMDTDSAPTEAGNVSPAIIDDLPFTDTAVEVEVVEEALA
jgi:hypothetical protein